MRYTIRTFFFVCAIASLAACGGGDVTTHSALPSIGAGDGSSAGTRLVLGSTVTTAALSSAGGIAATIAFPAVDTATTIDLSTAVAAPPGVTLQSVRHTRSDFALDIYEYITLVPKTTVSLPTLPALSFVFPATVTVAGKSVFFGITDPAAQPGALAGFQTEGPAKVVGRRASIAAVARPLVLQGGHHYTFVVYAFSVPASVTTPTIYVANAGSSSVTTYHADGTPDLAPIVNGIRTPQAVAVGPDGTIYVQQASQVLTFAANGTGRPPTIALPTAPHDGAVEFFGLGVGPNGTIDVPFKLCVVGCDGYGSLLRFAADGTALPAIDATPSLGAFAQAVDASGNIDVIGGGDSAAFGGPGLSVTRYSPDGRTHQLVLSGLHAATAIAVDAAGRLYLVVDQKIRSYNADGSPGGLVIAPNFVPGAIAVDAAGKLYVADPGDDQIVTYNPDGSPTAPTITTGIAPAGIAVR